MKPSKFRKKPVVIEAMQLVDHESSDAIGIWMRANSAVAFHSSGSYDNQFWLKIETPEGVMAALDGDWIIRGVAGEFYPCKPAGHLRRDVRGGGLMRYRLPDSMGGHEISVYPGWQDTAGITRVRVEYEPGEFADVSIKPEKLVAIEPELPEEPPNGSVVDAGGKMPFVRDDDAAAVSMTAGPDEHWHSGGWYSWAEVCEISTKAGEPIVRLVPDPAAGVVLPWVGATLDAEPVAVRSNDWRVKILFADGHGEHYAELNAKGARDMAAALLAAADAAEKEQP